MVLDALRPPPRAGSPGPVRRTAGFVPLVLLAGLVAVAASTAACGTSGAYAHPSSSSDNGLHYEQPASVDQGSIGSDGDVDFRDEPHAARSGAYRPDDALLTVAESAPARSRRAQRQPAQAQAAPPRPATSPREPEPELTAEAPEPDTATDARRGPLLIYTGQVVLTAFRVTETLERAVAHVEELGGYAQQRTSSYVVLRVPAEHFMDVLESFRELGDVQDVSWTAQDVGEEYRDLRIRLANARALRDRLESLLERAESIEDILAIETELERITLEIERILGRVRHLEDQVAYSTLTVRVGLRTTGGQPRAQRLPFRFLHQLGLPGLLNQ